MHKPEYKSDWKFKGNAKFNGKRKKETKGVSATPVKK